MARVPLFLPREGYRVSLLKKKKEERNKAAKVRMTKKT